MLIHDDREMSMTDRAPTAEWQEPQIEQSALRRYVETLRERALLIVAVVLLTTAAAGVYVLTADRVFTAESDLLVTPVSGDDPTFAGLGVIRESNDPTRDVATAARFVTTAAVALRVREELGLRERPRDILERVTAEPLASSNVVTITAEGASASAARDLANAFAEGAVADRTGRFHAQLDQAIDRLRDNVGDSPQQATDSGPESLVGQLARLEVLRGGPDPTLRVAAPADLPEGPTSPRPRRSLAGGLLAGLILGVGGAFALQVLDPRLRRETQLQELYRLPILARIPNVPRSARSGPVPPERLRPSSLEAYRTLRATLVAYRRGRAGPRSILVTSSSPGEGKTTTAINLASSLALAGNRVVLVEADLRRPAVGATLGVSAPRGTGSVLVERVPLEDALVTTKSYGGYLRLLLAGDDVGAVSGWMADRLFLPTSRDLIEQAKQIADYVIVDSPPLTAVIDALPLAQRVDDVLIVVRLGKTHLTRLRQLGELLARHNVTPTGFAVAGAKEPSGGGYYVYGGRPGSSQEAKGRGVFRRSPQSPSPAGDGGSDASPDLRPTPAA
jgi:capsular exopolysaccharide synthesis family protein